MPQPWLQPIENCLKGSVGTGQPVLNESSPQTCNVPSARWATPSNSPTARALNAPAGGVTAGFIGSPQQVMAPLAWRPQATEVPADRPLSPLGGLIGTP